MPFRIGVIGAMPEEIALLDKHIKNMVITEIAQRYFHQGQLFGIDSVIVTARVGKVAAAITATLLIEHFKVDAIILIGCAGGIDTRLNIGDVVIGANLIHHDLDGSPLWPKYSVPLLDISLFPADPTLSANTFQAAEQFFQTRFNHFDPLIRQRFFIEKPKVVQGLIASGDQFINSLEKAQRLKEELPELLCVEMEGAAIGQVCYENKKPFSVIRVISDNANSDAHVDFQAFNTEIACHYSLGIVQNLFDSLKENAH
jgi:adenosylhomocysteine nucleosidase